MTRRVALLLAALVTTAACGSTATQPLSSTGSATEGLDGAPATAVSAAARDGGTETIGSRAGGDGLAAEGAAPSRPAAAPSATSVPPAPAASIPPTGFGWDEQFVYVGVTTQKDVQTTAESVGVTSLDGGDQEAQANAVADAINARGGIFGRKIKLLFHDKQTVATAQNPDAEGQETCVHYTQDNPVVAVVNPVTLQDTQSFRACFAKARVALFSASVAAVDARVGEELAPYFYQSVAPTWDALAPVLLSRLDAQRYFTPWNADRGEPAPAGVVKVGVLGPDDEVGARVVAIVERELKRYVDDVVVVRNNGDFSSAVLQFRGNGVTHLMGVDADLFAFMLSAASQEYRPRYGVTSVNAPNAFLESNAPDTQLRGALGAGWSPSLDTSDTNDPGPTGPAETTCLQWLDDGGQRFGPKRLAEAVALAICDGLRLLTDGAHAGGGLAGPAIAAGIERIGSRFSTAFSFGIGLGPGRRFLPGAVRDLVYIEDCTCFRYSSSTSYAL